MDDNKVQELLLQLVQDMSYVKAKLDNIDEQKLNSRLDAIEGQNKEHDRIIKSLEKRNSAMEEYVRNELSDSKKNNRTVWVSIGIAVFTSVLGVIINFI